MYDLIFSSLAKKNVKKLLSPGLKENCKNLLNIIKQNPYKNPPLYEKLIGDLFGYITRSIKHRLIYKIIEEQKIVKILRMWTHYQKFLIRYFDYILKNS